MKRIPESLGLSLSLSFNLIPPSINFALYSSMCEKDMERNSGKSRFSLERETIELFLDGIHQVTTNRK